MLDLVFDLLHIGGREVDLVDHRKNFQIVIQRHVDVGDRLGFHALGRIDDQQRPVAGDQGFADFVGEVHVSGGVDQVEDIFLPVLDVRKTDTLGFNRNAPFFFDIHVVKHLCAQFPFRDRMGLLDDPVGQGAFPVVDVGDNRKVSDIFHSVPFAFRRKVRSRFHY